MAKKTNEPVSFRMNLPREVEGLFDEMIQRPWDFCREIRGWNPSIDLYETPDAFLLDADLPGVKREDVRVEVHENELILEGSRSLETRRTTGQFRTMERSSGHFSRTLKLPESVDKDAIEAEFHNGVLRVLIPKKHSPDTAG